MKRIAFCLLACLFVLFAMNAAAQEGMGESGFIFTTQLFIFSGLMGLISLGGFAFFECGSVKAQNTGAVLAKQFLAVSISSMAFFLIGHQLMFGHFTPFFGGTFIALPGVWQAEETKALFARDFSQNFARSADWFFQAMMAMIPVFIISAALGVRIRRISFLVFIALFSGILYPITGSWIWNHGWLQDIGFLDFGGATLIHSLGGWAALTGTILTGARSGRFDDKISTRKVSFMGANPAYYAAGSWLFWLGWMGLALGSQFSLSLAGDAADMAAILVNMHLCACAAALTASMLNRFSSRSSPNLLYISAIGGLVAMLAEPVTASPLQAILVGCGAALIARLCHKILHGLKIDDVSGLLPAHLGCGIWGTLAVSFTNPNGSFAIQALGALAIAGFAILLSFLIWWILKMSFGLKVISEKELLV